MPLPSFPNAKDPSSGSLTAICKYLGIEPTQAQAASSEQKKSVSQIVGGIAAQFAASELSAKPKLTLPNALMALGSLCANHPSVKTVLASTSPSTHSDFSVAVSVLAVFFAKITDLLPEMTGQFYASIQLPTAEKNARIAAMSQAVKDNVSDLSPQMTQTIATLISSSVHLNELKLAEQESFKAKLNQELTNNPRLQGAHVGYHQSGIPEAITALKGITEMSTPDFLLEAMQVLYKLVNKSNQPELLTQKYPAFKEFLNEGCQVLNIPLEEIEKLVPQRSFTMTI